MRWEGEEKNAFWFYVGNCHTLSSFSVCEFSGHLEQTFLLVLICFFSFFPFLLLSCCLNLKWMGREILHIPSFVKRVLSVFNTPHTRQGVVGLLGSRDAGGYLNFFLSSQFKPRGMMTKKFNQILERTQTHPFL